MRWLFGLINYSLGRFWLIIWLLRWGVSPRDFVRQFDSHESSIPTAAISWGLSFFTNRENRAAEREVGKGSEFLICF